MWSKNTPIRCGFFHAEGVGPHLDPQNVPVSPDVLRTMIAGAQKIINARPLTPVKVSPDDCDAVTPSSLLHHQSVKPTNPIGALPS